MNESYMIEIPVNNTLTAEDQALEILTSLDLDSFVINGIGIGEDPESLCVTFYGPPAKMYYLLINYVVHS